MFVLCQQTITLLAPWFFALVSIHMKDHPVGGKHDAPDFSVGEDMVIDFRKVKL